MKLGPSLKEFDIRTQAEWHELGAVAANRELFVINPHEVPEEFHCLIPYAERWAISCNVIRSDYIDNQPPDDVRDFYQMVLPHIPALNKWLDVTPDSDAKARFIIMLAAHCEAAPPPTPEEVAAIRKRWADEREARKLYWRDVARNSLSGNETQRSSK